MTPDCFSVGDIVRVRDWNDMVKEFGSHEGEDGEVVDCELKFVPRMQIACGASARIKYRYGGRVDLDFYDQDVQHAVGGYSFSTDMIEPDGCSDSDCGAIYEFLDEM